MYDREFINGGLLYRVEGHAIRKTTRYDECTKTRYYRDTFIMKLYRRERRLGIFKKWHQVFYAEDNASEIKSVEQSIKHFIDQYFTNKGEEKS